MPHYSKKDDLNRRITYFSIPIFYSGENSVCKGTTSGEFKAQRYQEDVPCEKLFGFQIPRDGNAKRKCDAAKRT